MAATIEGFSRRGHELLAHFDFERAPRERSSLASRLTAAGLPTHPIAMTLDDRLGGLRSPHRRNVGWLELGVLEELDDEDGYAAERIEGVDESERVDHPNARRIASPRGSPRSMHR